MDAGSITQAFSLLALLILLSAFFSAAQTAFSDLSKTRLKNLVASGSKNASLALKLAEHSESLQITVLFWKTGLNLLTAAFSVLLFRKLYTLPGMLVGMVIVTLVILIFAEFTPKSLAEEAPEKFALFAAPTLRALVFLLRPINFLLNLWKKLLSRVFLPDESGKITEEELITIVEEATSEGGIDEHESELIRSAIEFNDLEARSILTPRVDIFAADITTTTEELSEIFRAHGFSRIPIYRDTIDNIIGIIHEKDFNRLLHERRTDIKDIIHDVAFVPESLKISKLLRLFQESKVHMAIVLDEFGGTTGIVTLEDVLEGLVGDIWDEHDVVVNDVTQIDDNTYLVSCGAPFDALTELFGLAEPKEEGETVGAWVLDNLAKIPEEGDRFDVESLQVEVTKIEGRRAVEIKIIKKPEVDASAEEEIEQK